MARFSGSGELGVRLFCFFSAVLILVSISVSSQAQFLSRDFRRLWANEVFENYGVMGYRDYDLERENRQFDFFGDFLIDGVDVFELNQVRRDAPGRKGDYEARNGRYDRFFQKLIIANEGYGGWSTRLIIGDAIRTYFTPMTLNLSQFNGVRWDGSSSKSRFTVIGSQVSNPPIVSSTLPVYDYEERRLTFATALLGGHWESRIGDVLTLGTTYVNLHRFDSEASRKVNTIKGVIPRVVRGGLRVVYVFFTDDSPEDGRDGAEVHTLTMLADGRPVSPVRVGRIDRLIDQLTVTPDLTSNIHLKPLEISHLRRNKAWLRPVTEASNRPFFASMLDKIATEVDPATPQAPLRADGTDVVFYMFAVPDTVRDITFKAMLANDYSVDVVGGVNVPTISSGEKDLFYDWYNALRAEGRPLGSSNLRQVTFHYGLPTGLTVLGLNFDLHLLGFYAKGEYARSLNFFQVPTAQGRRYEQEASMSYVNVSKSLRSNVEVGFEWFDVPSRYSTAFSIWRPSTIGPTISGQLYTPFALVEDNDDLDPWSDVQEQNDPLSPYPRSSLVGYGVYPGLDLNKDGILDTNVDGAEGTDAYQPFLCYYSEPPDLVYGDDFNNNGVPDFRENDNLPDYLYPADRRGLHGFMSLRPMEHTQLRLGSYRIQQPDLGSRATTRYIEYRYRRDWNGLGMIQFNHRIKWVADHIPNPTYYSLRGYPLRLDLLEDRDSWDNLTYIETALHAVPGLNIFNILTYNRNRLRGTRPEDPMLIPPGWITHFSMVNKGDYTFHLGRLRVMPQFKHIFTRSKFPERSIPESQTRWIMPILRIDVPVGPHTVLKAGVQGFPFFPEVSQDSANPDRDFRRRTVLFSLQNTSNYRGYDLSILLGFYRTSVEYIHARRPSHGLVRYFLRTYIG